MKKLVLFTLLILIKTSISAQSYEVLNYNFNSTPVNGVKIKTNIPYTNGTQMPTVHITGYNFGSQNTISLDIVWYIYEDAFVNYGASSSGGYTPNIQLSNENGKVVIFINDRSYYQRFKVSVFAQGMSEVATWFTGWTAVDEALNGTNTVQVLYNNKLGNVTVNGNLGIGTTTPAANLDVNGTTYSRKLFVGAPDANTISNMGANNLLAVNGTAVFVKAKVASYGSAWPDYVFAPTYQMPTLDSLEKFIKINGHLPEIPTAENIKNDGVDLGENQAVLLKKVEELTLFIIDQNKQTEELKNLIREETNKNEVQAEKILQLENKLKALEKKSANQMFK